MTAFTDHVQALENRWAQALTAARIDVAVVAAGAPRPYFLDDQAPPYRANPHFAQWLGGAECPGSYLLVSSDRKPRLFLYQVEDYWHQPPETPDLEGAIDIEVHASADALMSAVSKAAEHFNRTAFVGETEGSNLPFDDVNPALLLNALHYGRAYKTQFEVDCLRRAAAIAVRGHVAAAAAFADGASEYEIHQAYLLASHQTESELPYASIVALNDHAGVLHYQHYQRQRPAEVSSFLIDAGARYRGYAADITRTYAKNPEGLFATLIEDLDERQRALIRDITIGMSFVDLHEAMHHMIAELLTRHGLVRGSATAAFERGITDAFFPHGLGHLIGLQTHDVAGHMTAPEGGIRPPPSRYPALRLTRPIESGQVFTIEPGLYFIPMLLRRLRASDAAGDVVWAAVDRLLPCGGIRIEDNVLVTEHGIENLTREAFTAT